MRENLGIMSITNDAAVAICKVNLSFICPWTYSQGHCKWGLYCPPGIPAELSQALQSSEPFQRSDDHIKLVGEPGLSLAGLRPALRAEFHLGWGWTRTGPGPGVFTGQTMLLSCDITHVIAHVSLNIILMSHMWYLSFLPSTTITTAQWCHQWQPQHGTPCQGQATTKLTTHKCNWPPIDGNDYPQMQTATPIWKWLPTTHWSSYIVWFGESILHLSQHTSLTPPRALAIKWWNEHTQDDTMQDNDQATVKQGHTTTMCQQYATMKTHHDNMTTARTQNKDKKTRPHKDKATMRTWQNDMAHDEEDTMPHE